MFFSLAPSHAVALNDVNPSLMGFYRAVASGNAEFETRLMELIEAWDALGPLGRRLASRLASRIAETRTHPVREEDIEHVLRVSRLLRDVPTVLGEPSFSARLVRSITDKLRRVVRLEERHDVRFDAAQMDVHVETACRAAFYLERREAPLAQVEGVRAAEFFVVRELCYGAMFRFNAEGRFNIPYGGAVYNRKNLRDKATRLLSPEVRQRFAHVHLSCEDFEACLSRVAPALDGDGFVFCDPPYDSEFSSYDNLAFDLDDHRRLARVLGTLSCRWLLVVKATPEVESIYDPLVGGTVHRHAFEKAYTYNVRGRNDRRTVHLVYVRGSDADYTGRGALASDERPPLP
jgi:DNA adenine methylase